VLLYASAGFDQEGLHFHPLFQFQLLGLLGAFLTGDLFNLFVFFEIMLLASYVLLAHGGGLARTRAGISYVVLNLVGSALFLIALGLLYGVLGTLNLADVARVVALPGHDRSLARLAFILLIAVFALKAGLLPLSFWLPHTYTAAGAPVAALFAIMTRAVRDHDQGRDRRHAAGSGSRPGANDARSARPLADAPGAGDHRFRRPRRARRDPPARPGSLAGPALGGHPLAHPGAGQQRSQRGGALLPDAVHTRCGLLPVERRDRPTTRRARRSLHDRTTAAKRLAGDRLPGPGDHCFLVLATTAAGLPPFSGFVGKLVLLTTLRDVAAGPAIWAVVLTTGFIVMAALARDGCYLIWKHRAKARPLPVEGIGWQQTTAVLLLVAAGPLLAVLAKPLSDFSQRAAVQLHTPGAYVAAVLHSGTVNPDGREATR